jgi:hypothetical protein
LEASQGPVLRLLSGFALPQGTADQALTIPGADLHHASTAFGMNQTDLKLHRPMSKERLFLE